MTATPSPDAERAPADLDAIERDSSPPRDGVDLRALGVRAALHEIDSALVSALEIDDEGTEEDAIGDAAIAVIRRLRALLATLGDPAAIADAKLRSEGGVAALGLAALAHPTEGDPAP